MHTLSTTTQFLLAHDRDEDYDLAQASDPEGVKRLDASIEADRQVNGRRSHHWMQVGCFPRSQPPSGVACVPAHVAPGHASTDAGSP
jgi:hypothetical protein